jgi:alkanesulfonate monooxygenase SsuD/methylene tetrahydromethanopterin reductase-like flavin-dependent oxidoreductase (luciferase family)
VNVTVLGAIFRPQFPPEQLRDVALAADAAGLEQLWLWEDCFRESGIAAAAAILAWTTNLEVGIGLLPMPLRNVALTAMELATAERLFPGRLHTGVGHGVLDWMGQVGARVASPLTLMREYVPALRSLLAGEEVSVAGRYVTLDRVRLDWPPSSAVQILAGAEGPKTLQLAGEVADGTILPGGTTPDGVRRARALIDEGRARAGRTTPHRIVVFVPMATGADADKRMEAEFRRWDFDPGSDLGVAGDAATVADAVGRWAAAGADIVVLQPTADEPDPARFVQFIAQDVRKLVTPG